MVSRMCSPFQSASTEPSIASQRNIIDGELVGPDERAVEDEPHDDADEQDADLDQHGQARRDADREAQPALQPG